ncbi:hypothetical protein AVEN_132789-1, partial [Araneus ventricosus]
IENSYNVSFITLRNTKRAIVCCGGHDIRKSEEVGVVWQRFSIPRSMMMMKRGEKRNHHNLKKLPKNFEVQDQPNEFFDEHYSYGRNIQQRLKIQKTGYSR